MQEADKHQSRLRRTRGGKKNKAGKVRTNVNAEARPRNCCRGKAVSHILSVCL